MTVAVSRRTGEHRNDYLRPKNAHDGDDVAKQRILRPVPQRLLCGLRETKIERAREELPATIETSRREQLLRADHAEHYAQLVANEILPTVAARQREVSRLDLPASREPRDELRVLVVRMCRDHEHARRDIEPGDGLAQDDCAALLSKQEARREKSRREKRSYHQTFVVFRRALVAGRVSTSERMRCCAALCASE